MTDITGLRNKQRGVRTRVSYNKLWKLLVGKKMSKADLRKAVDIAQNTLTKMHIEVVREGKKALKVDLLAKI